MSRKPKQYSEERDLLNERAAIIAEGDGWTQDRAERVLAFVRGFPTWTQLVRAVEEGRAS